MLAQFLNGSVLPRPCLRRSSLGSIAGLYESLATETLHSLQLHIQLVYHKPQLGIPGLRTRSLGRSSRCFQRGRRNGLGTRRRFAGSPMAKLIEHSVNRQRRRTTYAFSIQPWVRRLKLLSSVRKELLENTVLVYFMSAAGFDRHRNSNTHIEDRNPILANSE